MKSVLCIIFRLLLLGVLCFPLSCDEENYIFPPDEGYFAELRQDLARGVSLGHGHARRTPAQRWAAEYVLALDEQQKGHLEAACNLFKGLALTENFALHFPAVIHVLETCTLNEGQLVEIWLKADQVIPAWLRPQYTELSLKLAREKQLSLYIAKFAHELSSFQKVQQDKIDLLWEASKQFREDEDPESQTLYLQELYNIAPRLNPRPAPQDYYDTARDFEANREFKAARRLYQKIYQDHARKIEERVMALERYKQTFRLERAMDKYRQQFWPQRVFLTQAREIRQKEKQQLRQSTCKLRDAKSSTGKTKAKDKIAVRVCGKVSRKTQNQIDRLDKEMAYLRDKFMDNEIMRARAFWTNNQIDLASKILKNMQSTAFQQRWHPTGTEKALINWYLGQIALEQGKRDLALKYYQKALQENITDEKLRDDISWTLGLGHYLKADYAKAITIWQELLKKTRNQVLKERLALWLGQSLAAQGEAAEATRLWAQLQDDDLHGFYGISAQYKRGESFAPLKMRQPQESTPWPTLEWLKRVGEFKLAHQYLAERLKKIKSAKDLKKYLKLCLEIEWFDKGLALFYGAGPYKRAILEDDLDLAYPAPYQEQIAPLAAKYKVPLSLIYAVMRQESGLNRYAISAAHAYGLMQLTPETATLVARKHKIPYHNFNDLFNPRINAELGVAYLKDLLDQFKGHLIPAICSYNANMSAVKTWLKRKPADNLLFIEMIPYQETRQYVKAVLRNMVIYQQLLQDEEFKFPAEQL